jgi:hypothetical protein
MIAKYGVYDGEELRVKMDAIRHELKQWVQLYYDRFECLFVKGKIIDAKRRKWFLAHLKPKSRNCVWFIPTLTWMNYWQ